MSWATPEGAAQGYRGLVAAQVVLVHGWGGSFATTWQRSGFSELLRDAGRDVIGIDLLGHGVVGNLRLEQRIPMARDPPADRREPGAILRDVAFAHLAGGEVDEPDDVAVPRPFHDEIGRCVPHSRDLHGAEARRIGHDHDPLTERVSRRGLGVDRETHHGSIGAGRAGGQCAVFHGLEDRQLDPLSILEDGEVRRGEPSHRTAPTVHHRHIEPDHLHVACEGERLLGPRSARILGRARGNGHREHRRPCQF